MAVVKSPKLNSLLAICAGAILLLLIVGAFGVLTFMPETSDPVMVRGICKLFLLSQFGAAAIACIFAGQLAQASKHTLWKLQRTLDSALKSSKSAAPLTSQPTCASLERAVNELTFELAEHRRVTRELVERAVDVICIINTHGQIISVNRASESAWGWSPAELEGRSLESLLESEQASQLIPSILGSNRSIDRIIFESRLRRKDDALLDVVWTGHWSVKEQGFFCIVHDITQQKQLERMKAEFVSMVTHDLRTPLTSVMGVLKLMDEGVLGQLSDQGKRIATGTHKECERMLRLLNDMLELDKIEAGSFDLQCEQIDLAQVCREAAQTVSLSAAAKRVAIVPTLVTAACWADELRLSQVLLNLLGNAIKYAPENSPIELKAEDADEMVRVSVTDHGRGIPPEKLEKIFEPFEQVDASDARQKHGFGLGLAICKAIVSQHGGQITVSSNPQAGTTFAFTIPKAPRQAGARASAAAST